jgi:hypothetical protein
MASESKYWFPAKRYGWGWGLPIAWQGWVVLGAYFALLVSTSFAVPPTVHPARFIGAVSALSVLLIAVCWLKGEPPRWRWGAR